MSNALKSKIFLAYASEDRETIFNLYERLKQEGYNPWVDKKDLLAGQNWRAEIPRAIRDSSIFIACLSSCSVAKKGYVQREFKMALTKCADQPSDSISIIPLRLNDCNIPELRQEEYGLNLRDYQWVDYFQESGFDQLVKAIRHQFSHSSPSSFDQATEIPHLAFEFEYVRASRRGNETERCQGRAEYVQEALDRENSLDMVVIPSGTFMMGSPQTEYGRFKSEEPLHEVAVPSFMMGKYPVTQAQWRAVAALPKVRQEMNAVPSVFKGRLYPVVQVSWHDAQEFCARLSEYTKHLYRLPSEAEWEYACRAGTSTRFYFGKVATQSLANCVRSEVGTTNVCKYPPNAFGLFDMHGNIFEWCQDTWHDSYDGAPTDGSAWIDGYGGYHVSRGGSFQSSACYCRSAYRYKNEASFRNKNVGFRVCRSA